VNKKNSPAFTRRKLAAITRKAISSYYTVDEYKDIVHAAEREKVSVSSFVASAAIREARNPSPHRSQFR